MKIQQIKGIALLIQALQKKDDLSFSEPGFKFKFNYGLTQNKKVIKDALISANEAMRIDKKFLEYEKKRTALCEKFCKKGEDKKPLIKNGMYEGLADNKLFIQAINKLEIEYKDSIHDDIPKINFYKINAAWLPINPSFTGQMQETLNPLLEYDNPSETEE